MTGKHFMRRLSITAMAGVALIVGLVGPAQAASNNWNILSGVNFSLCLDIYGAAPIGPGSNVQVYSCHEGYNANQRWSFLADGTIRSKVDNNLCLDIYAPTGWVGSGSNVQVYTCKAGDNANQRWYRPGDGTIHSEADHGLCLDIFAPNGSSIGDGSNVQVYVCHGGYNANQKWVLNPVIF
ncbi:RICIN domain-containing protein [Actinocrispum wychmicini]|uniref:Ricin-type beta-trefoil lectin protein n=1 Tax=Actinocrispum wychmicini TaxID=1213861 RepID=A0A4R2JFT8_9PSEU|nr:RICIN domain-containing protein [Actinocrispum wychmicini]TCO55728.1 ricin-type beta-trefoil lectin protein [Actinocrispum wychmicini]